MIVDKSRLCFDVQPHIGVKKGDLTEIVLLPGDPERVEIVASFLEDAVRIGGKRGFVGYRGKYRGRPVSVMTTHMGGPSAAIAAEELIRAGARVLIRIGTCGAIREEIEIGDLIIAASATPDGTSRAYVNEPFCPTASFEVVESLVRAARSLGERFWVGAVRSWDAFYSESPDEIVKWSRRGILAFEMEDSAIFTVAMLRGVKAGAIHAVNGNLVRGIQFASESEQLDAIRRMIKTALEAATLIGEV